jgi:hypothetical protein
VRRCLFNIASVMSLLLCLATVVVGIATWHEWWTLRRWDAGQVRYSFWVGSGIVAISHYSRLPFSQGNMILGTLAIEPRIRDFSVSIPVIVLLLIVLPAKWSWNFVRPPATPAASARNVERQ